MPPRWVCRAVVVCWLATLGWLAWTELGPAVRDDAPAPFVIDLVDEAQPERDQIRWLVLRGDESPSPQSWSVEREVLIGDAVLRSGSPAGDNPLGWVTSLAALTCGLPRSPYYFMARSWVEYHEQPDDSFTFRLRFEPGPRHGALALGDVKLKRMNSSYRVDRGGRLLAMEADFAFDYRGVPDVEARLTGEARGGQFFGRYVFDLPPLGRIDQELPPVPLSYRGSVLLPLHPVNKVRGLRPGLSWSQPLVNPFADALAARGGRGPGLRKLDARVLPDLQPLPGVAREIPCLVIEYDDGATQPRTWVRAADGLVLRQEANVLLGERLVLQRDPIPDP